MIAALREDPRMEKTKFLLYGFSEGTMISSLVADRGNVRVDALLLQGYVHDNLYDVLVWQNQGNGIMLHNNRFFDRDGDGRISREEYEREEAKDYKTYLFHDADFEEIDVDGDGYITTSDLGALRMPALHEPLMDAIARNDDDWIRNHYMELTTNWFRGHFALEPNKSRLLRLDLPIFIFHGTHDPNVPVEDVRDIEERFRVSGKTNLTCFIFDHHNHDLNYELWLVKKRWPEGLVKIFETAEELSRP